MIFKKIITALIIVIAFTMLFCPEYLLTGGLIDDDASYVSHAFTIGLDFDLDYSNEIAFNSCMNPSGKVPCQPIGPGLMAAPFVAAFSLVDRVADAPVIEDHMNFQYSWSYFGFMFSTCFYFLAGVWLYARINEQVSSLPRSANLLFASGFGVLHYVFYRFTLGHAFEFFALAVVLWASVILWRSAKEGRINPCAAIVCSIGAMLVLLTRPGNLNVLILPPLVVCILWLSESPGDRGPLRGIIRNGLAVAGSLLVLLVPFVVFNIFAYGAAYPSPENMYGRAHNIPTEIPPINSVTDLFAIFFILIKLMPNVPKIVFSSEFGLLYTSPILIFGLAPLFYMLFNRVRSNTLMALVMTALLLLYVGLPLSTVLIWQSAANSYGYRYLFSLYPLALIGYSVWYHRSKSEERDIIRDKIINVFLIALSIYALLGQMFYGVTDRLRVRQQENVFGYVEPYSARGYSTALATALFDPLAWRNLIHVRLPGFVARDVVRVDIRKYGAALKFYDSEIQTMVNGHVTMPVSVIVQVVVLLCFCVIVTYIYLVRPPPQGDKPLDTPSIN